MKTIVWDPGMLPYNVLSRLIDSLIDKGNHIHIVTESRREKEWQSVIPECQLQIYQQFELAIPGPFSQKESLNPIDAYRYVIDDHRTLLIADRILNRGRWLSTFNNTRNIEIMVYNAWMFLTKVKPDFLVFQATPHALNSWLLGKVAEFLSIPVYMIQTSPLPWHFWMIEGLDRQTPVFPKVQAANADYILLNRFLEKNSASYANAIPSYEKKRIDSRGGKFWSWKKELKDCFEHPSLLRVLLKKRTLYDLYNSMIKKVPDASIKRIVFFMHYQPERTSLPEGKWFSQQWVIIRALSATLPNGWRLLVKEHPSIFTGRFDWRYRDPEFYRNISLLPNVDLISIEEDTFNLIDGAEAIATITGTVGVQALIRGTPVILFGYGSYRKAYGVFEIQNYNNLRQAFEAIVAMDKKKVIDETKEYLNFVSRSSVTALTGCCDPDIDIYDRDTRVRGHVELLKMFFLSMDQNSHT